VSWSSGDSPALSFDEPFCISERGCDNTLRRLTASDADVDQLDALLETVRFDANKEEWLTLLRLNSVVATGVFDARGALVGVATCSRYRAIGDRRFSDGDGEGEDDERSGANEKAVETFGWLGNVVVDASFRGRGVARALLRAALEDLGAANAAWLDASDMGMPLYAKAGFEPRSRVVEWRATVRAEEDAGEKNDFDAFGVDVSSADVFGALARLDASVFGADRAQLLRAWLASAPKGACFLDESAGYALAHKRGNATYLGPWGLAEDVVLASENLEKESARRRKAEAFVDAAVRRAVAAAARDARANGEADARVVAYVPEPLAAERGADVGAAGLPAVDSSSVKNAECTFSAGALMSDALARFGFERGDATTRMVRRDPACGGPRAITEPGCPERALTVASLDLG
jgi:GNAT superfamily N-acetyltransferase